MLTQMAVTDWLHERSNRDLPVSEVNVWRFANLMLKQYPETSSLMAAQRAETAYAAGQLFNFYVWSRVTQLLTESLQRTSANTVN